MSRIRSALLGVALCAAGSASAAGTCQVEWERQVGPANLDARFAGLASFGGEDLAVGAWLRPRTAADMERFGAGFWTISPRGEARELATVHRFDPQVANPEAESVVTALFDIAVLPGRRLFGAAEASSALPALVEVGERGETRHVRTLAVEPDSLLLRLIPLSSGALLGLGQQKQEALAVILTDKGEIQRRRVDALGARSRYIDALEGPGGRLLLLGNGGTYDMLMRGPSRVALRQIGSDGAVLKELSVLGRYGSLAALPDGSIAMVYDQADSQQQNIILQLYSPELRLLWERPVTVSEQGASRFRVAALPGGAILVGGGKEGRLFLAAFDAQGGKEWEHWRQDDPYLSQDYGLLVRGEATFVGTSSYIETGPGQFAQKVRVLKLQCASGKTPGEAKK